MRCESHEPEPVLWLSFNTRVPTNYYHSNSGPGNNKFMAFWQDDYEFAEKGATITTQLRSAGNGNAYISFYHVKSEDPNDVSTSRTGGDQQNSGTFIDISTDQGRWMTIVYKLVPSSDYSTPDGSMEMWRKWDNETEFTKYFDYQNVDKMNAPDTMVN